MKQYIKEVARGKKGSRDLSYEEATEAAQLIVEGNVTDAQLAALFIAERLKGESVDEVIAFVQKFREASSKINVAPNFQSRLVDFAGPYNGRKTFAATIPVALLLAEQGLPVYLHSSDSLPPKKGSALKDIIKLLDIPVDLSSEQIAQSIEGVNIAFAWTEKLSPPLALIRRVREEIGVRSFINTVEKALNLANSHSVMVGIFHKTVVDLNVAILRALGFEKAYIVQGVEGSEDLPIHRKSFLYEVTQGDVRSFDLDPEDYGCKHRKDSEREEVTLEQQVCIVQSILDGDESEELEYYRDQVLYNTGVRYFLFRHVSTIEEGIALAKQQLQQKKGATQLQAWRSHLLHTKKELQT
jgi:anthranilate phosphoribosyltransferase